MSDQPTVKPGIKSTEFYITAVLTVVGAVMALLPPGTEGEATTLEIVRQICGAILAGGASIGYTVSRGKAKGAAKVLVFALVLPLLLFGCTCGLEKQALEELDDTQDLIFPEYIRLVEKEFADSPDKIVNRKELVSTAQEVLDELKKQTEE